MANRKSQANNRLLVYNKCEGHCAYCGKEIEIKDMQVDHYFPFWLSDLFLKDYDYDVEEYYNLLPSCKSCNHYKRGDTPKEFRLKLNTLHKRVSAQYITRVAIDYGIVSIDCDAFNDKFHFEKTRYMGFTDPDTFIKDYCKYA